MLEFWADPASPYYRDWFQEDTRIVLFCAGGGRSALAAPHAAPAAVPLEVALVLAPQVDVVARG